MTLTLDGWNTRRALLLAAALLMMVASAFTIQHYFAANYPTSIFEGSFCDISAFFNCNSSAYSSISAVYGVPIGWFGLLLGGFFALGALFPSAALERTSRGLALLNVLGVFALLGYSVFALGSLCLLCSGYYLGSLLALWLYWRYRVGSLYATSRPSPLHLATFAAVTLAGAYGVAEYHVAVRDAQGGAVASRVVNQYFSLPRVPLPSRLSPYWSVRSTERFEDAPIRIVEYADPLCIDCRVMYEQMKQLKREFAGKINVAYQFFPLEAKCNDVVEKDKHPGACELSYILAADSSMFQQLHDEVYDNFEQAKKPEWRAALAQRYGLETALTDSAVQAKVHQLIQTGTEYEKTSDRYAHGIRSTPTLIINNRMVIGTLPVAQLRAIFRALVDEQEMQGSKFLENWVDPGCVIDEGGGPPKPCAVGGS